MRPVFSKDCISWLISLGSISKSGRFPRDDSTVLLHQISVSLSLSLAIIPRFSHVFLRTWQFYFSGHLPFISVGILCTKACLIFLSRPAPTDRIQPTYCTKYYFSKASMTVYTIVLTMLRLMTLIADAGCEASNPYSW